MSTKPSPPARSLNTPSDPVEAAKAGRTNPTPGALPSRTAPATPAPEGLQPAAPPSPKPVAAPPVPKEVYVVVRGGRVSLSGQVLMLREGQEVDAAGYGPEGMKRLRDSGIELQPKK